MPAGIGYHGSIYEPMGKMMRGKKMKGYSKGSMKGHTMYGSLPSETLSQAAFRKKKEKSHNSRKSY